MRVYDVRISFGWPLAYNEFHPYLEQINRVHHRVFLFHVSVPRLYPRSCVQNTYCNTSERAGSHVGSQREVGRKSLIAVK
jgi:hypothetical protein